MDGRPLIAIGLDAADPNLLLSWTDSGLMPNLQSIRDRGCWARLDTPAGLGDDAVWASFSTGSNPGKHGRFFYRQQAEGRYSSRPFLQSDFQHEPFWAQLSRSGCRVAVIDVPKSPLSEDLNGIQVADWRVHGPDATPRSWPPDLAGDLIERFGDDDTDRPPDLMCLMHTLPDSLCGEYVNRLLDSIRKKSEATKSLLATEDWDLFLVVFKEAHCAGHQCWHLMDREHPRYNGRLAEELAWPMQRIYRALDDALGGVLTNAPDHATVIVFSTLGMSRNATGEHLLDAILMRLEPNPILGWWQRVSGMASRIDSPLLHRYLKKIRRRLLPFRTAFQVQHNELSGAVRLNLRGREAEGRVAPSDVDSVLSRLENELASVFDPETRLHSVAKCIRAAEAFEGEQSNAYADLFVEWTREADFEAAESPTIGRVKARVPEWRPGNHVSGGIMFACGPSISVRKRGGHASIIDLAPSIAAMLGQTLPDAEGRPIDGLAGCGQ